jgi:L-ascorbate metabolism protein UlaG (beta-lactamase superfamily)
LLERITESCAHLIHFSRDFVSFHRKILERASGGNLDEYYDDVPESLRGIVEITYDLNNRPVLRVFDELSGEAGLCNDETHEIMFFSFQDEKRGFFLNTPRLDRDTCIIASAAFDSSVFNTISQSRIRPVQLSSLLSALRIGDAQYQQFRSYFTVDSPHRIDPAYAGELVRLRYFGHACVLLQTSRTAILLDPLVAWERDDREARFVFDDLPDFIDYVFITHSHPDHFCPEVLLQLRKRIGKILVPRNNPSSIADPSIALALQRLGFDNVVLMSPLDEVAIPEGFITSVPFMGEHGDLDIYSKQGSFVQMKGRRFLFLADSTCLDRMVYRHLSARIGNLDALFIGMECHGAPVSWLYGPYFVNPVSRAHDDSRRLSASNCERAWAVVDELKSARVFVYAMGQEPWLRHILGLQYEPDSIQMIESDRFVRRCITAGMHSERLYGCQEMLL